MPRPRTRLGNHGWRLGLSILGSLLCLALDSTPTTASCISLSSSLNRHIGFANIGTTGQVTLYVVAIIEEDAAAGGIQGAEFRLDDYPPDWFIQATPNPAANFNIGDMLVNGVSIFFPSCQFGINNRMVWLYTLNIVPTDRFEGEIRIRPHSFPGNPLFRCVNLTTCSRPHFVQLCVPDCAFCVNPGSGACTSPIDAIEWSSIKSLYR